MSCTVKNCKNIKRLLPAGCNISFHRFPHDKELFQEWLDVLALDKHIQWTKNRLVCSDHFTKEDFVPCGEVRRLKPNVVPSLKPRTVEPVFVDVNSPVFNEQLEQNRNGSCEYSTIEETITEEGYPAVKSEYIEPVFVDVNQPFSEEHLELPVSANCNGNTMERVLSGAEDGSNSETLSSDINSTSDLIRCVQLDHQYFTSPKSMKRKLERVLHKHLIQKKQLYSSQEKVKKLEKKVNALKRVVKHLQTKCSLSNCDIYFLEKTLIDPAYKTQKQ